MKRQTFLLLTFAVIIAFSLSACFMKPKATKVPAPAPINGAPTREELERNGARCAGRTCTMPNGDIYDCTLSNACSKVGGDARS